MNLVVTHDCNKKCSFCIDKYRGSGEYIILDNVRVALEFAKSRGLVEDILIIGGEPTLHPQIVEIALMIKMMGFRSIMTTNYTKPDVVAKLDGIVNCFNISHYNQPEMPNQRDMMSDITINKLIHKHSLNTKADLNDFIDEFEEIARLKFSTLSVCNEWTLKNQAVDYLNDLPCEWVIIFNEILGQMYRGCLIKRYDRVINESAKQSLKAHVDGEISLSWDRDI